MRLDRQPIKRLATVAVSNVDKKSADDEIPVRLVNYTDVYYGDRLKSTMQLMGATATARQRLAFGLQPGDVIITKDSETADDIGVPAFVESSADDIVLGYHLALLRPRSGVVNGRYLYWSMCSDDVRGQLSNGATGVTRFGLRTDVIASAGVRVPSLTSQRAIADFLDTKTARIDDLINKKRRLVNLLEQRVDSTIRAMMGTSPLAGGHEVDAVPIRRVLAKLERWTGAGDMVTAFRDGVVTTRESRGRDGFTNAWTDAARVQRVEIGDVVIHGLDGFSGAIGEAQRSGVCSPVYHVCNAGSGDGAFYGRMLRILALDGYLGNFATSTRERAVDFRNWDLFGRIPVPFVPIDQQGVIGDEIRRLRPLGDLIRRSEVLALEHRQALITAAVTGEMAVPGVAA